MPDSPLNLDPESLRGDWIIATDRDGTLVPYADRPEEAKLPDNVESILYSLAECPGVHVAVISARSNALLKSDFHDGNKLTLAGNYGMEILFPDGREVTHPAAKQATPNLVAIRDDLAGLMKRVPELILEDHGLSLCMHFHLVESQQMDSVHEAISIVHDRHPSILLRRQPTSYEFLPDIRWTKASALQQIDENLPLKQPTFFFAGDTDADEPAISWVNEHGGISVKVGPDRPTAARICLDNPERFHAFLENLLHLRQKVS